VRIALLNWSARQAGGVETYLARLMPALSARGHQLKLVAEVDRPGDRPPILADAASVLVVEQLGAPQTRAALDLWRPDVVYDHGVEHPDTERLLLEQTPSLHFVHNYNGMCISGAKRFAIPSPRPCARRFGPACLAYYFPRRCGGLNPLTMVSAYARQGARLASLGHHDQLATHSEYMRRELVRHGLPSDRVHRIPWGVIDDESPSHAPRELSSRQMRLLFLGRMEPEKGGPLLLAALPRVRRELGCGIHLTMAGDGQLRSRWEELARRVDAPDVVISFPGWVAGAELAALLASGDLMVVPSVWPEPLGQVGIEAARFGVPAVAFSLGGIPDWLEDGVNGVLAPARPPTADGLATAIVRALEPSKYPRLSSSALAAARRYSMAAHLDALEALLVRAARERTGG